MNINQAVGMTIEFLSPVLPNHMKRQALPFSYMNVEVRSVQKLRSQMTLLTVLQRFGHSMVTIIPFNSILMSVPSGFLVSVPVSLVAQ